MDLQGAIPKKTHGVYDLAGQCSFSLWEKTCGGSISLAGWSNASGRLAVRAVASAVPGGPGNSLFRRANGGILGMVQEGAPLVIR